MAWALLPAPSDANVLLKIASDANEFTVQWPTNATGFTLQIANQLPLTNGWQDFGDPVSVSGDQFVVTNPPSAPSIFFRLFKAQGETPILSAVTVSTNSITDTNAASLQFSFHDPEGNIVALQVVMTSSTDVSTQFLDAPSLSLNDLAEDVLFPILPLDLTFGGNTLVLRLIDDEGHTSDPATVFITLVGDQSGGSLPRITSFQPIETTIKRPGIGFELAELDGNSFPDLLLIAGGEKKIHLWLNKNGTGFTTARQSPLTFEAPFTATVADFDGNGAPDLAVSEMVGGSPNSDHVKVPLGN